MNALEALTDIILNLSLAATNVQSLLLTRCCGDYCRNTGISLDLFYKLPSFRRYKDQPVPDASAWTVDEVVEFFTEAGFAKESEVFRDQVSNLFFSQNEKKSIWPLEF